MFRHLLNIVAPRLCCGCGVVSPWGVCRRCLHRFRRVPREPICFLCRQAERSRSRLAGFGCTRTDHCWALGWAAFWMEHPLDRVIHGLKYRHAKQLGDILGRRLAGVVPLEGNLCALGIPMTRTRRRERGYNQTEIILRSAVKVWGISMVEGRVQRRRQDKPQAQLDLSERSRNIEGSFGVPPGESFSGISWVLLDDVATTGATFVGAMQVMRLHGAQRVCPVALALA